MPFFNRKNARIPTANGGIKRKKVMKTGKYKNFKVSEYQKNGMEDEISSDDELGGADATVECSLSEEETEQEKKLRLTKNYIERIKQEESEKLESLEVNDDAVARRLKDDALESAGRLMRKRADEYRNAVPETFRILKGHKLSITCIAVSSNERYLYTASKDCSIIKWDIIEGKKLKTIAGGRKGTEDKHCGHCSCILSMALSSDFKFLATGCQNKIINIWNPDTLELIKRFKGHKGAITGLTFTKGSHQLISASSDCALKVWNLDEMGYVETLFGHQDGVTSIDSFIGETAITSGGRDNTVRIWKIVEESQLVYQGHGSSIDCVCVTNHDHFVSGADDGSLSLWCTKKKKPVFKVAKSHGCDPETNEPFWVASLCALKNSDVIASGSQDGFVRLWMRDDENRKISPLSNIPIEGFVNYLQFSQTGKYLIAGLGQEHRSGRWWSLKKAKNVVVIYRWSIKS